MSRKEVRPDERLVAAASGCNGWPFDNKPEASLKKDSSKGSATRGEQRQPVDASPTFLLGHTTYHCRTTASPSTSRSPSPQNCGAAVFAVGSSGGPTRTCGAGHHDDDNRASLPIFPSLQGTATVVDLAFAVETSSQQDIAMEAMRLSKQTLSRGDGVDTEQNPVNPRLSMALPMKLGRCGTSPRLNKFVRRLHDMLTKEKDSGLVEWRRGLLVLKSTGYFAKHILPKYFNTRNFKTFRRQLNYYGFVHIRSFSNAEQSTCALWVNGELAKSAVAAGVDPNDVASVLLLRRVEIADQATTNEMRRIRKELAISTIEQDLGISAKALQLQTLTSIGGDKAGGSTTTTPEGMLIEHMMSEAAAVGQCGRPDRHNSVVSETLSELGEKLEVESVVYFPNKSPRPTIGFAEAPLSVVSATDESVLMMDVEEEEEAPVKAPPSNASAANLLLLLSRA